MEPMHHPNDLAAAASVLLPSEQRMTSFGSNGLRAATTQALSSAFRMASAVLPALSRLTRTGICSAEVPRLAA